MTLDPNVFDIHSVLSHKKDYPIIKLANETTKVSIPGIASKVTVRKNVDIVSGGNSTNLNDIVVESGSDLTKSLMSETNFHASYLGMTVEAGGGYSYESTINRSSMYALMAIDQTQFSTTFNTSRHEEKESLSQDFLEAVSHLPPWKDSDTVVKAYRDFFEVWGTHAIRQCHYGSRFALQVETENAKLTDKTEYKANVKAEFGKNFGTDGKLEKGRSFEEYQKQRSTKSSVTGGNRSSSMSLQRDPGDKKAFNDWAASVNSVESSAVTGIRVEALGQTLIRCGKPGGNDMIAALKHFTKKPSGPITVYGYVYTSTAKSKEVLTIDMQGVESFEIGGFGKVEAATTSEPDVKKFTSEIVDGYGYYFAGWIKINGMIGQEVVVGFYSDHDTRNIHLHLHPPGGPISILFNENHVYCRAIIPSLLDSGNYMASLVNSGYKPGV